MFHSPDALPERRPPDSRPGGLPALLVSLQLADSAFPSGFYTLSHGLEGYAQAGAVTPDTLPALLADLLRHGVGPSDATALVLAHRAVTAGELTHAVRVDRRLYAAKLSRETRQAATRTGRQLLDLAAEVFDRPPIADYLRLVTDRRAPGCQAVAAGIVQAAAGVPVDQAVAADLYAFAASFAGAALRLRLTDHRRAQVLLRGAAPVIEEAVAAALVRPEADLGAGAPAADIMSGRHERADARLFAT
ncbi:MULTISPECIES: urease accessory UreF family protein [Kitasatospora]|uniref:Urease accessory protein UreF n=1 Tax=Kitasatospora setae (strain ATCC 33774 / DSM 43861 / JCM 3304 / KCC A-0304 / NBRC 14216 / KM-6054) TaxID=452652 RepID=E4N1T2_KITSK|nr:MULTISPECIES: urease accessory UreF family protein [Kitasatospora]BAJ32116.1 putative urease accessroy protein [Kitasatospora setae KM-6054]